MQKEAKWELESETIEASDFVAFGMRFRHAHCFPLATTITFKLRFAEFKIDLEPIW